MDVCGFMVVRRPAENYVPGGKGIWPTRPPRIGSIYYGGAWRMPWFELEVDRNVGRLPPAVRDLYLAEVNDREGSGFALCRSFEIAEHFLEYSNRDRPTSELIAVYSPRLASMKGTLTVEELPLLRRGWEPFQLGGGSLLLDGLFVLPARFPFWTHKLNDNGLFTASDDAILYASEYQRLVQDGVVEELFPVDQCPIEPIEVLAPGAIGG